MKIQNKILVQRRKKLMKKVARTGPFIEGTLAVTERMCGGKGCVCRRGKKHKAMYLTWKEDGKTQSMYIPVGKRQEALMMSRNYKKMKKLTRKLSDLHKKVLLHKEKTGRTGSLRP